MRPRLDRDEGLPLRDDRPLRASGRPRAPSRASHSTTPAERHQGRAPGDGEHDQRGAARPGTRAPGRASPLVVRSRACRPPDVGAAARAVSPTVGRPPPAPARRCAPPAGPLCSRAQPRLTLARCPRAVNRSRADLCPSDPPLGRRATDSPGLDPRQRSRRGRRARRLRASEHRPGGLPVPVRSRTATASRRRRGAAEEMTHAPPGEVRRGRLVCRRRGLRSPPHRGRSRRRPLPGRPAPGARASALGATSWSSASPARTRPRARLAPPPEGPAGVTLGAGVRWQIAFRGAAVPRRRRPARPRPRPARVRRRRGAGHGRSSPPPAARCASASWAARATWPSTAPRVSRSASASTAGPPPSPWTTSASASPGGLSLHAPGDGRAAGRYEVAVSGGANVLAVGQGPPPPGVCERP